MRRKAVHLLAAIAESLRFLAVAFLAFDVGALLSPSVSGLLRYAAAPQLLFAAGFFFLWLDSQRYGAYRPLLLIGKAACLVCFLPLAFALMRDPGAAALAFGIPAMGLSLAFLIVAVDIATLTVLALVKPAAPEERPDAAPRQSPGQGPDQIERVEGL
jgi:hypothetical protein